MPNIYYQQLYYKFGLCVFKENLQIQHLKSPKHSNTINCLAGWAAVQFRWKVNQGSHKMSGALLMVTNSLTLKPNTIKAFLNKFKNKPGRIHSAVSSGLPLVGRNLHGLCLRGRSYPWACRRWRCWQTTWPLCWGFLLNICTWKKTKKHTVNVFLYTYCTYFSLTIITDIIMAANWPDPKGNRRTSADFAVGIAMYDQMRNPTESGLSVGEWMIMA